MVQENFAHVSVAEAVGVRQRRVGGVILVVHLGPLEENLAGQPTLRRRLKLAVLAALDQRISTRYAIAGMTLADTVGYVRHHLQLAGRADPLFSDDAVAAIHQASRGYPRQVNNLAVAALIATYAADKAIVDQQAAQAAITENSE